MPRSLALCIPSSYATSCSVSQQNPNKRLRSLEFGFKTTLSFANIRRRRNWLEKERILHHLEGIVEKTSRTPNHVTVDVLMRTAIAERHSTSRCDWRGRK
jgi:hypothetical protein